MLIDSSSAFWEKAVVTTVFSILTLVDLISLFRHHTYLHLAIHGHVFVVSCTLPSCHLHYISDSFFSDFTFALGFSLTHGAQA